MSFSDHKTGLRKHLYIPEITSVLIIFFGTVTLQAQSLIPELEFKNPRLMKCAGCVGEGQDGAVYIFENVGWGMDALVTIQGRSDDEVTLFNADLPGTEENATEGTGLEDAWQPGIQFGDGHVPAQRDWWMEFKISFVKHQKRMESIAVNQFYVTGLDIDGDGNQLHEYQLYYQMNSFSLYHQTAIFASSVSGSDKDPRLSGKRFDGSVKNYPGISTTAEDAKVTSYYAGAHELVVRLGAETGKLGSAQARRKYGLLFRSLAFGIPVQKKFADHLVTYNN